MKKLHDLRKENGGELPRCAIPGMYPIIYWFEDENSIYPLCGKCAELQLDDEYNDCKFIRRKCGADYDESLLCTNCYTQLSAYFEPALEKLYSKLEVIYNCYLENLGGNIQGIVFPNTDYFIVESQEEQGLFHITNGEDNGEQYIVFTEDEVIQTISKMVGGAI